MGKGVLFKLHFWESGLCALRRVSCLGLEWRSVHPLPNPLEATARSSIKVLIQLTDDDAANGKQKADQSRLVGLRPDGRAHYIAFKHTMQNCAIALGILTHILLRAALSICTAL
jgi:hypothetical protein